MTPPGPHEDDQLDQHLRAWLGEIDASSLAPVRQRFQRQEIGAGQTLMREGEPGDAMYLVISGRLRAYVRDAAGHERPVREMGRGQVVGEMALFTHEPRSASVVAVRDSVLARLDGAALPALLAASPAVSIAITRQTVQRLRAGPRQAGWERPVAMALLPVSAGVEVGGFGQRFAAALARHGSVAVVDAACVDAALATPGIARSDDPAAIARVGAWLDAQEAAHRQLLLVADDGPGPWTERCCRRADELLLLADATQPPALHPIERQHLAPGARRAEAAEILLLEHPAGSAGPRDTRAWLARRPVALHLHLRQGHEGDLARLARIQTRSAVGLVFAGGGARGFAHLGVLRALEEAGIEVDLVGGTSMGAVMSALAASGRPAAQQLGIAREVFALNPTGDLNLLPLVSLIRGRRLRRAIDLGAQRLLGHEGDAEDLWKPWFCVASNYSKAREEVIVRGPLAQALRASTAIPGALPPVPVGGDLLCDGGTFNNFPVDVMRAQRGVGWVIGVDLAVPNRGRVPGDEAPSPWQLIADRLRHPRKRRFRFPGLVPFLMNVTILYSASRQEQARRQTDVYLRPPLARVGMLQWNRIDAIVEQGYQYAKEQLARLPAAQRAALKGEPAG